MVSSIILLFGAILCLLAIARFTVFYAGPDARSKVMLAAEQDQRAAIVAITDRLVKEADSLNISRRAWRGWRPMAVFRVERESSDCRSFYLKDSDDQPLPPFLPGQYITVGLKDANGRMLSRCYSLSEASDWRYFRITVKRVPGGKVSNLLHDTICPGAILQVRAPSGLFTPIAKNDVPLVLIAAGIGITPIAAIARHAEKCEPSRAIQLFYQVRDLTEAPLLREIARWAANNHHVRLYLYLSKPSAQVPEWVYGTGRLTAKEVLRVCGDKNAQFMFCGPGPMLEAMQQGLTENGVPESMITVEAFEAIQKVKEAEDKKPAGGGTASGANEVSVRFAKSHKDGICDANNRFILEAAEAVDIEIESGCRSGQCGTCLVKILKGSVGYEQTPGFGPLEPGQALACVAVPENGVEIDA